jgi:hypothetical protein
MGPLFGPRTVAEGAFLVAVPVIGLEAGLSWYAIVGVGAAAYVLVIVAEGVLSRRDDRAAPVSGAELDAPPPSAATIIDSDGPRRWNVWDLERVAREHAGSDPVADEERTFLLKYLRDFAGPDGMLPVDFDDLVRKSFGGLVANP